MKRPDALHFLNSLRATPETHGIEAMTKFGINRGVCLLIPLRDENENQSAFPIIQPYG